MHRCAFQHSDGIMKCCTHLQEIKNKDEYYYHSNVVFTVRRWPCHFSQFLLSFTGSMTILPTVLFLITGVLRETAVKTGDNSVPLPVSAALQGIKTIITSPLARVESTQTQWTGLVRSSLASVLEYSQPGKQIYKHTHTYTPFIHD